MHLHDHYKELCALALSGQIAPREREELEGHLSTCVECRTELGDFAQITTAFPRIADGQSHVSVPAGVTERFLARARSEGIPLSRKRGVREVEKSSRPSRALLLAFAAILAALAATYLVARLILTHHAFLPASARIFAPGAKPLPPALIESSTGEAQDRRSQENADMKAQIEHLREDLANLSAKMKSDQDALHTEEAEKRNLGVRVAEAETSAAGLRQGLAEREAEAAQLKTEFEKLKTAKEADAIAFRAEENELNVMREQMANLEVKLQESEQLSEVANEAKDLVVARKLHIVDVNDTDGNGRKERPFGRIFYAEGKSLKFYAYDLADPRKLNAKISFYVWGSKEGTTKSVKNLGIFHNDDVNDRRWVLEFKDAQVLAQIDCVFVTAESDKKLVTQPTGRQILFASLGRNANHP